jgi:FixJ family two-component response regulator
MTVQAMKAGAVDFLTKPFRDQELLDAIHKAVDRDRKRRQQHSKWLNCASAMKTLRERVSWRSSSEAAQQTDCAELGTSETTVKIHRGQVMRKMQAESLPDLVRMAERICIPSQKY